MDFFLVVRREICYTREIRSKMEVCVAPSRKRSGMGIIMALITCNEVSLAYEGKTVASNITFSIEEGDYLCIVGENGSGKSTLIKGLLGLKQPSSGSILPGDGLKQNQIGYLPQQTPIQRDFPATVYEVVLSGCLNRCGLRPFYRKNEKQLAQRNMERLGILPIASRCYRELSGGQQQRVLLARALCATRKLLLLDEPAAGLDPIVTSELYDLVQTVNREDHISIVMVSHDIKSAVSHASHILHLAHTPLFFGTTGDYLKSEPGRLFLGGPHGTESL